MLHYACMWGWTPIVKYLVDNRANINVTTVQGKTPLMLAAEYLHDETIDYLVSVNGIHVDSADVDGTTALIHCVLAGADNGGALKCVELLLKAGADPNIENRKKKTALSEACRNQDMALVNLLLDNKVTEKS